MRATHEYIWKIGPQLYSNTTLRTNKPVDEGMVLFDLFDGNKYLVQTIRPAKPTDKEWSSQPDTLLQTWSVGSLSEEELNKLREEAHYTPNELCFPLGDIVFRLPLKEQSC